MANPNTPHLFAITLDGTGVAVTQVVAVNRTTGERLINPTDANKRAVFDASNFESGYTNGDIVDFENVGASLGGSTITINTSGGFQSATITCAAAPTGSINL